MTRLPNPGSDDGTWGNILNEFLSVEHNSDGTLKSSGSLASKANDATVVHITGSETITGTKTFSVSPVVPSPTASNHAVTKTYVDSAVSSGTTPDATSNTKGKVQLAGDLAGSAAVPTIPALAYSRTILPTAQGATGDYTGRFGTPGTGTDNRAAIQAALNAASDVNDPSYYGYLSRRSTTVKLPPGHYWISAPSNGTASLIIPPGVLLDTTDATLYFDYPTTACSTWCGIQVGQYGQLHIGKVYTSGKNSAPDSALVYDAIRLVQTDNNSRVIGYGDSEIRGFQGAGIRGVGCWIVFVKGIRFYGLSYGYVASNVGDGTLGYALSVPSGSSRTHTDLRIQDCHFVNISNGGFLGMVQGTAGNLNSLDFVHSGLTVGLLGCVFESIGTYAIQMVSAFTVTALDCAFEEVGNSGNSMIYLSNCPVVSFLGTRINLAGRSVPGPSGNVTPFPAEVFQISSVQNFTVDGLYIHNTYNPSLKFADNAAATGWRVSNVYPDADDFTASAMYVAAGVQALDGTWNKGHVAIGGHRLWVDSTGELRHKGSAPTSDTDGSVLIGGVSGVPLKSGLYYVGIPGNLTTNTPSEANELAVPLLVGRTCALNAIVAEVVTAGTTGALLRLGIRADSGGQPGGVLVDAGAIAAETTGAKEIAISLAVNEGTTIWLTLTVQGGASTRPVIRAATSVNDIRIGSSSNLTTLQSTLALYQSGAGTTTGTLPASQTWSAASTAPRIAIKAA